MPSKVKMPFGKYKRDLIGDIPSGYLAWFLENSSGDQMLRREIAMELLERLIPFTGITAQKLGQQRPTPPSSQGYDPHGVFNEPTHERVRFTEQRPTPPPNVRDESELARELVEAGYKALARKYHPDAGGNAEMMARLNNLMLTLRSYIPKRKEK